MKYRVWWIPQVGAVGTPFYIPVESPEEAKKILDILAAYDCYQLNHRIKPDYCNSGGLQVYDEETGDWNDWFYDDDTDFYDDVDEYCENKLPAAERQKLKDCFEALFSQVHFDEDME